LDLKLLSSSGAAQAGQNGPFALQTFPCKLL